MRIRNLREGDASQVLNLIEQCGPYVAPYNVYAYWILENYYSSTCYIAEENNRIIGFISGMPSNDKQSIFIWQLCVHSEFRGRRIAVSLLDSLISKAKELKFEKIELSISESNSDSQNLFKSYLHKNDMELLEKKRCSFGNVIETVYEFRLI
ncbi:MAG TPA: GNAT family N-acetyltransferase [Clostridia bacterium]